MSVRSIPIFSANLSTFLRKLNFWAPKMPLFDAQTRYDMIRYIFFYNLFFFALKSFKTCKKIFIKIGAKKNC